MKKLFTILTFAIVTVLFSTNCTSINRTLSEPNILVKMTKSDFTLSDQVSAEAQTTKILGVDWSRLFTKTSGTVGSGGISFASIPVIGGLGTDRTMNYALYDLMTKNPGYDVVFYPQYETKVVKPALGIGFLIKITNVNATARLGKLNK